jgi:uncharacterized protein (DUF2249 family)
MMTSATLEVLDSEGRADADALVLWQVAARAEALLEALASGTPSQPPLQGLLGYLRNVVLTRITEEETALFEANRAFRHLPAAGSGDAFSQQTRRGDPTGYEVSVNDILRAQAEHLLLRGDIEDLAEAAAAGTGIVDARERKSLTQVVGRLVSRLEAHLLTELVTLTNVDASAAVQTWPSVMGWYPCTESSCIDLSTVPREDAERAVLSRVSTMQVGERLDVTGDRDMEQFGRSLQHARPGLVGWSTMRGSDGATMLTLTVVATISD